MINAFAEKFNKHEKRRLEMQWKELDRKWAVGMKRITRENYEIRKELTKLQELKRNIIRKDGSFDSMSSPGDILVSSSSK